MVDNNGSAGCVGYAGCALGFLFPGQGAQYPGMALDLLESPNVRDLFALASDIQGQDMAALIRDSDGETLKRSDIAQPTITLANLSAAAFLAEAGILPRCCAGFSLGEYAALVCAGVLTAGDCFQLVKARGRAMQDATDRTAQGGAALDMAQPPGMAQRPGMAAVIGLSPDQVEALIAQWTAAGLEGLYGANYNSPKQVVVSGTAEALAIAQTRFKEAGAKRFLPLPVAGPFHSPLMADAAAAFAAALEKTEFHDPKLPCYSNVSGGLVASGAEAKALALRQITEPVRWTLEEQALVQRGDLEAVLEVGPGKVLQGLWRDSGTTIPCHLAGTKEQIENLIKET